MNDENLGLDKSDGLPPRSDTTAGEALMPGKVLAARRQELNWSVEDVAHSLHLAPRQIHAIESGNYGALPGVAVTRGFIRSYAKLLKLDPAPLLQSVATESDSKLEDASLRRALPDKPFYANRSLSSAGSSRSWVRGAMLVILIALITMLVLAWKANWLPATWVTEAENLFANPVSVNKAADAQIERTQNRPEQEPNAGDEADDGTQKASVEMTSVPQVQGPSEPQGAALSQSLPEQGVGSADHKDLLVLKLREDSWIEIRDARNKVLVSRLAKAGESETVPVGESLKLVIGNAAGVDAQLRGVPVELNASAKSNVARLTVN